jgi:hypothetical protein
VVKGRGEKKDVTEITKPEKTKFLAKVMAR